MRCVSESWSCRCKIIVAKSSGRAGGGGVVETKHKARREANIIMFGKSKPRGRKRRKAKTDRLHWLAVLRERRVLTRAGGVAAVVLLLWATGFLVTRLEAHVNRQVLARSGAATLAFIDLPHQMSHVARDDLNNAVAELLLRDWTDDSLCREMAERLGQVGWLAKVNFVRRTSDARFEVSGTYRVPEAMVQYGDDFVLVDQDGVRLPGSYRYAPTWMLVQGVSAPPPAPGKPWRGKDLRAALKIIGLLQPELFAGQITAVLVDNIGGRLDARRTHVELATDRAGGRIRWGSAPGMELEENSVSEKLAILRANYRETGRADANHTVIDVSTFSDRFTIPG